MPELGSQISQRADRHYAVPNNKIKLESGDGNYPAKIAEIWIHYVQFDPEKGRDAFSKNAVNPATNEPNKQKARVRVILDGTDICLEKSMTASLGEKARFAKLLESLTGVKAGSPEMRKLKSEQFQGMPCVVELKYNEETGYTNVESIGPPMRTAAAVVAAPAQQPAPALRGEALADAIARGEVQPPPQSEDDKADPNADVTDEMVAKVKDAARGAFIHATLLGEIVLEVTTDTRGGRDKATMLIEACKVGEARKVMREIMIRKKQRAQQ